MVYFSRQVNNGGRIISHGVNTIVFGAFTALFKTRVVYGLFSYDYFVTVTFEM